MLILESGEGFTDPPLNAPTGLLTGTATASCNCDLVVWNDLLRKGEAVRNCNARVEEASRVPRTRDAMVAEAVERLFVEGIDVNAMLGVSQSLLEGGGVLRGETRFG